MGRPDETMTHEKNNKSKIVVADQTVTLNQLESCCGRANIDHLGMRLFSWTDLRR